MSMEDRDGSIWMDGALRPWREATVHMLSYTFQHGAGFFEGVRAYDGELGLSIFRLNDHTRRFFDSAAILQMALPFSKEEINQAHRTVIEANGLGECYLRPVGYYDGQVVGVSAAGNSVHVAIAAWPWNDYLGAEAKTKGVNVKTSSFIRHHVNAVMGKAKANGHYINSMMAVMEARQQGFQDALMLDASGHVAECSTSNVFVIRDGVISTPEKTAVLEGITRATLIELAREAGFCVTERRITRDELYVADEVFVTGTAAEVTPVVSLDNRTIGQGRPGEITQRLQQRFEDVIHGRDPSKHHWLTPVG